MKLSASNIGWNSEQDDIVMRYMADHGFNGLEIAPTRVFSEKPYEDLVRAAQYAARIHLEYGLEICSMQSIWYGKPQRIAESKENRDFLLTYTEQAIRFAIAIGCRNLVFGCPRNRFIKDTSDELVLESFLWDCAEMANKYGVIIALEANPTIYHTNYINTTAQAVALIKRLNHPALKLNLDFGTVIENKESLEWISESGSMIHHVHISEPGLVPVKKRTLHKDLKIALDSLCYRNNISLEVGRQDYIASIFNMIDYVREVFG